MKNAKIKSVEPGLSRRKALGLTPVKNLQLSEKRLGSGEIVVSYPVMARPWMAKLIRRVRGTPPRSGFKKLQLDDLGAEVWQLIDGQQTVQDIVAAFAGAHQLDVREAEVAVTQFLRDLGKRGLIGLK